MCYCRPTEISDVQESNINIECMIYYILKLKNISKALVGTMAHPQILDKTMTIWTPRLDITSTLDFVE